MSTYNGWEVGTPHIYRNVEQVPAKPLGVFWDIENCNVPSGKSAIAVCDKIRKQQFFQDHREILFAVVCDATKESRAVLEELDKAQVDIIHVTSNKKNAADDKLKQLMRRFADLHRDGSRIVLISGDMDFAADIADFKRRMCLSVILLHNCAASESLILAASQAHNFYEILSTLPVKHETLAPTIHDEITVSNLPSTSDCPEITIVKTLNQIARQYDGKVINMNGANGSADLKFSSADQAKSFKGRYLHFKIQERPINIHFNNKNRKTSFSRARNKSFSQSPGPAPRARNRTKSESQRRGQTSSEEYRMRRFSSQESVHSDLNTNHQPEKGSPKFIDVSSSFNQLSLSKMKHRHLSESSMGQSSCEEDGKYTKLSVKTHSKIRAKLKLKNRKKSEATQEFLNQRDMNENTKDDKYGTESPIPDMGDDKDQMDELSQISTNLSLLIDTQLVRLGLIDDLYKERYQTDLINRLGHNGIQSLPNFIQKFCKDLTTVNFNMVPHIALRKGEFVQNYLKRVNDVLYSLQRGNDYSPVPVSVFEQEYRERYGTVAFLDLDFVARECSGIRKTSRAFDREFLELNTLFMLGNELVWVLGKKGGIIQFTNLIGIFKAVTGKNLDPTNYGFDNLEDLIRELDLFVKVTGKKKSVVLSSIHSQLTERMNLNRASAERDEESEYATADDSNVGEGMRGAASSHIYRHNIEPDIIGETHQRHQQRQELSQNGSRMNELARGLHPTISPALKSLRQEQLFKSKKLKLTSFVNTKTQVWKCQNEGGKYTMGTAYDQDIPVVGDDGLDNTEDLQFSSNTSGDIITIEDSLSEAESSVADQNSSSTSTTSRRGRKKSRLAANFSGTEQ